MMRLARMMTRMMEACENGTKYIALAQSSCSVCAEHYRSRSFCPGAGARIALSTELLLDKCRALQEQLLSSGLLGSHVLALAQSFCSISAEHFPHIALAQSFRSVSAEHYRNSC